MYISFNSNNARYVRIIFVYSGYVHIIVIWYTTIVRWKRITYILNPQWQKVGNYDSNQRKKKIHV